MGIDEIDANELTLVEAMKIRKEGRDEEKREIPQSRLRKVKVRTLKKEGIKKGK